MTGALLAINGGSSSIRFLGVALHRGRNAKNAPLISRDTGRVKVRVIRTGEELTIATSVCRILKLGSLREG